MAGKRTPLIGVYVRKGQTMIRDIFPVLEHYEHRFRTIGPGDLRTLKPGDADVLLFPGGWYLYTSREAPGKKPAVARRIRDFVRAGGGYVGICCGAINACILGLIKAEMINMEGLGPGRITVTDGRHPVLRGVAKRDRKRPGEYHVIDILRYNGWPMILKRDARMICSYDRDRKIAAIAAAEYGAGRVVAFSPHPEGATCGPGVFRDRDRLPIVYDGIAMGTARMLDNALRWCAGDR